MSPIRAADPSDYGRDLNVDVTHDDQITGGVIGVQVKSGASFHRDNRWVIPARPVDWEYWRSSTVPLIGMVYDPDADVVRWRNLTQTARSRVMLGDGHLDGPPRTDELTEVEVSTVLDETSYDNFVNEVASYLAATAADDAFLLLVDANDEVRYRGIGNCWTLARRDPRPLILLRRLLPSFTGKSLLAAISVLAHAADHPDIFWTAKNWIPLAIQQEVQASLRWQPDELADMVDRVETSDQFGAHWERGGIGQSLWALMSHDPELRFTLPRAIRSASDRGKIDGAMRLLICYEAVASDPIADAEAVVRENPRLRESEFLEDLLAYRREAGRLALF
jgi:hypothetical protein